jgi:hypothetical protein
MGRFEATLTQSSEQAALASGTPNFDVAVTGRDIQQLPDNKSATDALVALGLLKPLEIDFTNSSSRGTPASYSEDQAIERYMNEKSHYKFSVDENSYNISVDGKDYKVLKGDKFRQSIVVNRDGTGTVEADESSKVLETFDKLLRKEWAMEEMANSPLKPGEEEQVNSMYSALQNGDLDAFAKFKFSDADQFKRMVDHLTAADELSDENRLGGWGIQLKDGTADIIVGGEPIFFKLGS